MTGVHGLEGIGLKLLGTEFQVRLQWEDPSLGSEVGHQGLKFVQVGREHLSEPERGGIV